MQSPQFPTQDDADVGNGIAPISQWHEAAQNLSKQITPALNHLHLDPSIGDILFRLRNLLHKPQSLDLSNDDLHDLTCFVVHRLLHLSPLSIQPSTSNTTATSGCFQCAIALYMLTIQGPTYFSHTRLQYDLTLRLKTHLEGLIDSLPLTHGSLTIWLLSIGIVASNGTPESNWYSTQARTAAATLELCTWDDIYICLQDILWLKVQRVNHIFRNKWEEIWTTIAA